MTLLRPPLLKLLAPALAFAAALAVFVTINGRGDLPSAGGGGSVIPASRGGTQARVEALQAAVRRQPDAPRPHALLGRAYLQRVREVGDPGLYSRAEAALARARRLDPREPEAVVGLGELALARHDFAAALELGREARRLAPESLSAYPVVVDAEVELGRYRAAAHTLQRWIDSKPTLSSYARASYVRELQGDLAGALAAMRLAASAGGDAPENVAYVQTLIGDIEWLRGRASGAADAYRAALVRVPGYLSAQAGLARVEAAAGDYRGAIRRYRAVVDRLPLPEHVIALAESELAAGRRAAGRRDLELVRAQQRLQVAGGVNTDLEFAVFEADHGSPAEAVRLARRSWAAAPSVRSADALGWALTAAGRPDEGLEWARRALRLGSRDPLFLYHAGVSAERAGRPAEARGYLSRSLSLNPRFSPYHAPRARRALEAVS